MALYNKLGSAHDLAIFLDHALHAAIAALASKSASAGDSLDHFPKKDRRLSAASRCHFRDGQW